MGRDDGMQPTFVCLDEEILRKAIDICEVAIENTSDLLIVSIACGTVTKKDKLMVARYEAEIAEAKKCRNLLRVSIGWPPIE